MKNMVRVGGGPGLNFKGVLFSAPRRECVFAGLRVKRGAWLSSVGAGPGGAAAVGPLCAGEGSDGGGRFWKRWSGPGCCRGEADACGSGGGGLGLSRWLSEQVISGHGDGDRWQRGPRRAVAPRAAVAPLPVMAAGGGGGKWRRRERRGRGAGGRACKLTPRVWPCGGARQVASAQPLGLAWRWWAVGWDRFPGSCPSRRAALSGGGGSGRHFAPWLRGCSADSRHMAEPPPPRSLPRRQAAGRGGPASGWGAARRCGGLKEEQRHAGGPARLLTEDAGELLRFSLAVCPCLRMCCGGILGGFSFGFCIESGRRGSGLYLVEGFRQISGKDCS